MRSPGLHRNVSSQRVGGGRIVSWVPPSFQDSRTRSILNRHLISWWEEMGGWYSGKGEHLGIQIAGVQSKLAPRTGTSVAEGWLGWDQRAVDSDFIIFWSGSLARKLSSSWCTSDSVASWCDQWMDVLLIWVYQAGKATTSCFLAFIFFYLNCKDGTGVKSFCSVIIMSGVWILTPTDQVRSPCKDL